MEKVEILKQKIKKLEEKQKNLQENILKNDLNKLDNEVKQIKTFKDFNEMVSRKDRRYNDFLITNFRKEKKKEKVEPLEKFLNLRVSAEDKKIIKNLKNKKINVSLEIRNFLKSLDSDFYYELHLEKIKLEKINLKKIEEEIRNKIKKLSEILFKEFNLKNAEERYILKFEIKDLQIKKNKIEIYLKKLGN